MKLAIGFSPCPNDTFIFDALVNNKIDTRGIQFDVSLEDVETLNRLALEGTLAISKISYAVLPMVLDNYIVLNSGSALGSGVGPLLIAKNTIPEQAIENCLIAIPGEHTTAHMLFALAYPNAKNKIFLSYDEIENFILTKPDKLFPATGTPAIPYSEDLTVQKAGVIIHENRFTYEKKGLKKIIDLGDFWQDRTGYPIPLGGIVAKRTIDVRLLTRVDNLIKQSIQFAYSNYPVLPDYIRNNSREMEEDIMRKHIELYVNEYSISLGDQGRNAVTEFLKINRQTSGLDNSLKQIFLSTV
jgi:1,4-dihydroxy-6-naphthoate synthase